MMKRTVYEAPITERFQVELEGVFCASVIMQEGGVSVSAQDISNSDTFSSDAFDDNTWTKLNTEN